MTRKDYTKLIGKYVRCRTYANSLFIYGKVADCKDIPYSENYLLTITDIISEKRTHDLIYTSLMSNKGSAQISTYVIANLDMIPETDYLRIVSLAFRNERLFNTISQTLQEVKPLPWT